MIHLKRVAFTTNCMDTIVRSMGLWAAHATMYFIYEPECYGGWLCVESPNGDIEIDGVTTCLQVHYQADGFTSPRFRLFIINMAAARERKIPACQRN